MTKKVKPGTFNKAVKTSKSKVKVFPVSPAQPKLFVNETKENSTLTKIGSFFKGLFGK